MFMATITRTLILKSDDEDLVFPIKDLDFTNILCDLESNGIDVMGLAEGNVDRTKVFTIMRALISVLANVPLTEAGKLMTSHLRNGGAIEDIFSVFAEAMNDADFGKRPQDHKKPQTGNKGRKTTAKR